MVNQELGMDRETKYQPPTDMLRLSDKNWDCQFLSELPFQHRVIFVNPLVMKNIGPSGHLAQSMLDKCMVFRW